MIAHVDADSFFASVLQRKYPNLRNKPLLALGMGGGCVIAASYEAKNKGVKTGMRLRDAMKLVPEAISMPSDFEATYVATRELFGLLERYCPGGVERSSPDEGYMNLSHRTAQHDVWEDLAKQIQSSAHTLLDLPVSVGIAPSKTLAKMASKHNKPKGICVIKKEDIMNFLKEKPIDAISGIGYRLTPKMQNLGYHTAFQFAKADRMIVQKILGKTGLDLQAEIQGIPIYHVVTEPDPPKSISRCRSFKRTDNKNFLYAQLTTHLQRCSAKLRMHGFECGRIGIWLYKAESILSEPLGFQNSSMSRRVYAERIIGRYVCEEALLLPCMKDAFDEAMGTPASGAKLFMQTGLVLHDFHPQGSRQISLFENMQNHKRIAEVQKAIDRLRKCYGNESVQYGGAYT